MPLVEYRHFDSFEYLRKEGQEVLDIRRAESQYIREMHIGLLNMMPDGALKPTERQFLRLIGSSNRIAQFYVHIFTVDGVPRSPEMQEYIDTHYEKFDDLAEQGLDALIVTGTNPVHSDFADEAYIPELKKIFQWADTHVTSVLCSCLASHAAFKLFYDIDREPLPEKLCGVFSHKVIERSHPLLNNVNTRFDMPHSRYNQVRKEVLCAHGLEVLVEGEESGVALATSSDGFRHVYLQGHPEYDVQSLFKEYERDLLLYFQKKIDKLPPMPKRYFNEQTKTLLEEYIRSRKFNKLDFPYKEVMDQLDITWRDTAKGLFANWIGLVYQITHKDRKKQYMDGINPQDPLGRLAK